MSDEKPHEPAGGPDETVILRRPVAGRPDGSGERPRRSRESDSGRETVVRRRPKPPPSSSPSPPSSTSRRSPRGPRKGGDALLADLGLPATRTDGPTGEGTRPLRPSTPPSSRGRRGRRGLGVPFTWIGQASWTHVVAVGSGVVLLAAGLVTVALNLRDTGDEVTRVAESGTPPPTRPARPVPAPPRPNSGSSESAPPGPRADESSPPPRPRVEPFPEPAPARPEPPPSVAAPPVRAVADDPPAEAPEPFPGPDELPMPSATSGTNIPLVVRVVAEEDESVLPGVILSLEPGGHVETSNAEGVWTFYELPEGVYTLTARLDGYYDHEDVVQKVQAVDRVDYTVTLAKIPPPPDPKPLIEAVLEAYRNAYEDMDLLAVQETYPDISERLSVRLGRQFDATKALEYAFGPPEYTSLDEIEGSARVKVEVTQKLTPNAGPEQEEVFDMEFSLERPGDEYSEEWLIVERARLR